MSYMRHPYYIYKSNVDFNFDVSSLPIKTIDEFVVMRIAQLTKKEIKAAEIRAMRKHAGNFGCDELLKKYGKKTALEFLKEYDKLLKQKKCKSGYSPKILKKTRLSR